MRNIYPLVKRTAEINSIDICNSDDDDENNNDGDKMLGEFFKLLSYFF